MHISQHCLHMSNGEIGVCMDGMGWDGMGWTFNMSLSDSGSYLDVDYFPPTLR